MKAGVVMNVTCLLVLQLAINTWARAYFHLDQFPDWAQDVRADGNATTAAPPRLLDS